ncbi:Protein EMBRYO SAC DEVELOPMENT ARREST 3, chloroplastic [Gracilariopsis chorda]|uniref:Protein EMBRYO SAC DEVELOPMENT ARREST 3, chloroplastic n=1 Tax=Gracilariopsis chorda TaxID=448386 RepID=A0A2V3IWN0_9FLOR|nr:Protein EMBRYO SAC DEVELOPMENT ARREST 3, chloroplastic [Gracilariopsis chorda]|eukprot:PXF46521.1 Protein EMBRYO SAC DEVELOPMENT ARREST 3, chloroplastic [Gracilariopsis chorda]
MHSLKPAYILPQPRASSRVSRGRARCQTTRRDVLRYTLAAVCSALLPRPTHAAEPESEATKWRPEDLCGSCFGRGKQTCSLCSGSGVFTVDDSVVIQDHVCPNCTGAGTVTCPTCIGLGLANTNGILRNAARDGKLRMLRNGSYEILDCSAFPVCDMYNERSAV